MYFFEIDMVRHYYQAYASSVEINRENGKNSCFVLFGLGGRNNIKYSGSETTCIWYSIQHSFIL